MDENIQGDSFTAGHENVRDNFARCYENWTNKAEIL